jgi:glycosyltransferase involved in cell wall biosynthesis
LLKASQESKKRELALMQKADIVFTVSHEEKAIIDRELGHDKSIVTPIFVYRDFSEPEVSLKDKEGLLFVGGYGHTPNVDAVLWFANEILPLIRRKLPDVKLTLAGSNPTPEIRALACENIEVTGFLSDAALSELYARSRVVVIPLRFGAGVKGKTVDAMYNRMAVVSTSIGLEGLPGIDKYLGSFDDAEAFANEVIRLYLSDEAIAEAYSRNIEYVKENLSWESAFSLFESVFGRGKINSDNKS